MLLRKDLLFPGYDILFPGKRIEFPGNHLHRVVYFSVCIVHILWWLLQSTKANLLDSIIMTKMSNEKIQFYANYDPSKKVEMRIPNVEDDSDFKAPFRDILGVLESEEAWSPDEAMPADEIRGQIIDWDSEERHRPVSTPSNRTVRNQLAELEKKGLVMSRTPGTTKTYWKIPDDGVGSPVWNQVVRRVNDIRKQFENFFHKNRIVLLGTGIYAIGGAGLLLNFLFQTIFYALPMILPLASSYTMIFGIIVFIIGHLKHKLN